MPVRALVRLSILIALIAPAVSDEPNAPDDGAGPTDTPASADTSTTDTSTTDTDDSATPAGHSGHGEAFNEGPRQKAYLMTGTGIVDFPVTTDSEEAQQFITQGVGQLHGFWYFEAERSFRQAAAIDPSCAMAYWGMAMANTENDERAKGFIAEAVRRKKNATKRETMYIDALEAYHKAKPDKKKERNQKYTSALEEIVFAFPDDVEAKAFVCLQIWLNHREKIPISSYLAADALLSQVLAVQPNHPSHHYRIHLWDRKKAARALESAALCGQAAPGIAHMWHMPGHIYSKLKRYDDAAWQQEASARVDHAHMMRDQVLPDQIHNFAHNNEWLIRNLINLGRVNDAVDLAFNMIELPRHPKHNHFDKRGSAAYGRMRLFDVLARFEMWDDLLTLSESPYLERTTVTKEQIRRLRYVGKACFRSGRTQRGNDQISLLDRIVADQKSERDTAGDKAAAKAKADKKTDDEVKKAREDARKPFSANITVAEKALHEMHGYIALSDGDTDRALELFKKGISVEVEYLTHVELEAGRTEAALKRARSHVKGHKNEVLPLASLIETLWAAEKPQAAEKEFELLRRVARFADLTSPVLARLAPIAEELGYEADWRRQDIKPPGDVGTRPNLDTLGPFRWQPSAAPQWTLTDATGKQRSLARYSGRPVVVIFYLGYGCLHCAEQLQAFAPKTKEFEKAGLALIAISTDDQEALSQSHEFYDEGNFPFPLTSNSNLDIFRAYRAYDDFEDIPLHGTFLIDANGFVRWHDIGHEPFNDPDFLLQEAKRLLAKPVGTSRTQQLADHGH